MNRKDLRILVIEDEDGHKVGMERNLLKKCGFSPENVTFVDNNIVAFEDFPAPETKFDIVFSDIHTFGGNGVDYAKSIKDDAAARGVKPVPVLLHSTDTRTAEKYLEAGLIDGLISKQDLSRNSVATLATIEKTLNIALNPPTHEVAAHGITHDGGIGQRTHDGPKK